MTVYIEKQIERNSTLGVCSIGESSKYNGKNSTILSVMRAWIMIHINKYEVIGPKPFRDEIQMEIMEAYKKYCM